MAINYTPSGITISDDAGQRPSVTLPPDATHQEVEAAATAYHQPSPDWDGFRRVALGSQVIAAAMAAARGSADAAMDSAGVPPGEPAATYLAAAYDVAATGDLSRLAAVWPVLVVRGEISPEGQEALAVAAENHYLPAELVAILRGS